MGRKKLTHAIRVNMSSHPKDRVLLMTVRQYTRNAMVSVVSPVNIP